MATKKRTIQDEDPQFSMLTSKEELIRLRDTEQNSWASVAKTLNLGSPGMARRLYSAAVRPHTESVLTARSTAAAAHPVQLDSMDLETVRATIVGHTIIVERSSGNEEMRVGRVTSLKAGTVNFHDGNKARSVKASAVLAIK